MFFEIIYNPRVGIEMIERARREKSIKFYCAVHYKIFINGIFRNIFLLNEEKLIWGHSKFEISVDIIE